MARYLNPNQLMNSRNTSKTMDDIQLVFLELPKFKPNTRTEKKLTALWLRFLTEINEKTEAVDAALLDAPIISKALSYTEISAYTPAELRAYDKSWDAVSTEKTLLYDNYQKGREEEREVLIKPLLSNGCDAAFVAKNTGVSLSVVLEIQNKL